MKVNFLKENLFLFTYFSTCDLRLLMTTKILQFQSMIFFNKSLIGHSFLVKNVRGQDISLDNLVFQYTLFLEQFYVHSKIEQELQHYHSPLHTIYLHLSYYQHFHQRLTTFVTNDTHTFINHYHPSLVYIRVPYIRTWCYTFYGFWHMYNDTYPQL